MKIGIIGLGYVGLPLALHFAEAGSDVLGFDIDADKVSLINGGGSPIRYIDKARVAAARSKLTATADPAGLSAVDAIIICVPTPLTHQREPDMTFIVDTLELIGPHLRKGQLISLESTTYPGTTDEIVGGKVRSLGFEVGKDIFVVYSPEREDPGNAKFNAATIPKVIGGTTPACLKRGKEVYSIIVQRLVEVSSTRAAEMTKLLENIHRSVNISLVNEMKIVANKMGVDIFEVIDAAATKPFGFTAFFPGPGLGGHCIPIDPFYLAWKAREYGLNTRFIELSGEIDNDIRNWVLGRIIDGLNGQKKALNGSRVHFLGIAYKKNVDDARESPSIWLMEAVKAKGGVISYTDPFLPRFPKMREHHLDLASEELTPELLGSVDCVVVATDHDVFDYEMVAKHARLVVDTRGRYRKPAANITPA
ncbi:MAG: nucleotide sugar dehydrogenase [Rhizobiales bacterium]|nr:nucleotide sugar dehydrogenase [Hyphomicrobiales bacterium]OJU32951.1 MAG: UDP-N-acetyl-D-glucosamine dehydrogenase [Rhizobiales bacterium 68-8]